MRRRNHKCLFMSMLVVLGAVVVISLAGCTDNPESADAKQIRQDISRAQESISPGADYDALQSIKETLRSSLQRHQRADEATKDAARLTIGNISLSQALGLKSDLGLKTLPLRNSVKAFEESLRLAESTLLEKERIEGLLVSDDQEMAQLKQFISGGDEQAGLQQQLETVQAELTQLQDEKGQEQTKKDKTQSALDDYQARADDLLRKAELAEGDARLKLEKQAYAILKDRKQHYIEVQASEDKIGMLDDQIKLVQTKVDLLKQSIQETQDRIGAIETSDTRSALKRQLREAEQGLSEKREQLNDAAVAIATELKTFQSEVQTVCDMFGESAEQFKNVRSSNSGLTARLQEAESYHHAAQACASAIEVRIDLTIRLDDLLRTADPTFADTLRGQLPITAGIDTQRAQNALDLFEKAIESYQDAYSAAGRIDEQAQCDVLKSQLLTVDSQMLLAERVNMPEIADQAQTRLQELVEKGQEFGVSFTQSQTIKLIESGINYKPSLPVNLDVLAEQLATELGAWKRLPLEQQEAAVEANLVRIDELIGQYGQALANKLEPYRQEMLTAQQRGFEEPQPGTGRSGDPNNI